MQVLPAKCSLLKSSTVKVQNGPLMVPKDIFYYPDICLIIMEQKIVGEKYKYFLLTLGALLLVPNCYSTQHHN